MRVIKQIRIVFYLFFFLFCAFPVTAKSFSGAYIKKHADKAPYAVEKNLKDLVDYLILPFDNDYDKAKVIAFWIAGHIAYDEYVFNPKYFITKFSFKYKKKSAEELLKSRVGICIDYTEMFYRMAKMAGINVTRVEGKVLPVDKKKQEEFLKQLPVGHAWNTFKYEGRDVNVDVTFMSYGAMEVKHRITEEDHNRELKKAEKRGKRLLRTYHYTDYYFDFTDASERKIKNVFHKAEVIL